ncbi:MAG: hypothetical protein FWH10_01685 [Oscillospiraceae bacterium]|nr:hypothetical protein [Oscillospiraceae bacterium]
MKKTDVMRMLLYHRGGDPIYREVETPVICPYCGAYVEPKQEQHQECNFNNGFVVLITFQVKCCNKQFYSTYTVDKEFINAKLISTYPPNVQHQLPESISNVSPRFAELFKQAKWAEENGFIELAGTGYRNSIEILVKDYAIAEHGKTAEEVSGVKLAEAIKSYLSFFEAQIPADVIRVLGNNYTHYKNKHEDIGFDVLLQYVQIFINMVDTMYLINHPPVHVNPKLVQEEV